MVFGKTLKFFFGPSHSRYVTESIIDNEKSPIVRIYLNFLARSGKFRQIIFALPNNRFRSGKNPANRIID